MGAFQIGGWGLMLGLEGKVWMDEKIIINGREKMIKTDPGFQNCPVVNCIEL